MGSRFHTFRGLIPEGRDILSPERLQCDNGSITKNWKVTNVELFGNANDAGFWVDPVNAGDVIYFYLHYKREGGGAAAPRFADLRNNNQFAWVAVSGASTLNRIHTVIDPGHIIVEDLFITVYMIDSGTGSLQSIPNNLQYQITIEEITTSEAQGVLSMVKGLAQGGGES